MSAPEPEMVPSMTLRLQSSEEVPIYKEPRRTADKTGRFVYHGDKVEVYAEKNGFFQITDGTGYIFKNAAGVEWDEVTKPAPPPAPVPVKIPQASTSGTAATSAKVSTKPEVATVSDNVSLPFSRLFVFEEYLTLKLNSSHMAVIHKTASQSSERAGYLRQGVEKEVNSAVDGFYKLVDGSGYVYKAEKVFEELTHHHLITLKIKLTSDHVVHVVDKPIKSAKKTGISVVKGNECEVFANLDNGYYCLVDGSGYIYKHQRNSEWVETNVRQKIISLKFKTSHVIQAFTEPKLNSSKGKHLKKGEDNVVLANAQSGFYKLIDGSGYIYKYPAPVEWEETIVPKDIIANNLTMSSNKPTFIFEDVISLTLNSDIDVAKYREADNSTNESNESAMRRGDQCEVFSLPISGFHKLIDGNGYIILQNNVSWIENPRQDVVISKLILTGGPETLPVYKEPSFASEKIGTFVKLNDEVHVFGEIHPSNGFRRLFDESGYIFTLDKGTELVESNTWKSVIAVKVNSNHLVEIVAEPKASGKKTGVKIKRGQEFLAFATLKLDYYELINGAGFILKSTAVEWIEGSVAESRDYLRAVALPRSTPTAAPTLPPEPPLAAVPEQPPTEQDNVIVLKLQSDHNVFVMTPRIFARGSEVRVKINPQLCGYEIFDEPGSFILEPQAHFAQEMKDIKVLRNANPAAVPHLITPRPAIVVQPTVATVEPPAAPVVASSQAPVILRPRLLHQYILINNEITLTLKSNHRIPIFDKPNISESNVGTLSKDGTRQVYESMESSFYRICDGTGYIYSIYKDVVFTSTPKQYVVTLKLTLQSNSNVPVFSAPSHASVKTASLKKGESVQVYPIPQSGFYYLVNGSGYIFKLYDGTKWMVKSVRQEVISLTMKSNHVIPIHKEPKPESEKTGETVRKGDVRIVFVESVSSYYALVDGTGYVYRHPSVEWTQGNPSPDKFHPREDDLTKSPLVYEILKTIQLRSAGPLPIYKLASLTSVKTGLTLKNGDIRKVCSEEFNGFYKLADDSGYVYKTYQGVDWTLINIAHEVVTVKLKSENDNKISVQKEPGIGKQTSGEILQKGDEIEVFTEPVSCCYKKIDGSGYVAAVTDGSTWIETIFRKTVATLRHDSSHDIPIFSKAATTSEKIGKVSRNQEIQVFTEKEASFYRLINSMGYVYSLYKDVKWVITEGISLTGVTPEPLVSLVPVIPEPLVAAAPVAPESAVVVSDTNLVSTVTQERRNSTLSRRLTRTGSVYSKPWRHRRLFIASIECRDLPNVEMLLHKNDVYVELKWGDCEIKTTTKKNAGAKASFPKFDKHLEVKTEYKADPCPSLEISVYDYNNFRADVLIGTASLTGETLINLPDGIMKTFPLELHKRSGFVDIELKFTTTKKVVTMLLNSDHTIPVFKEPSITSEKTGETFKKGIEVDFFAELQNGFYVLLDRSGFVYKHYKGVDWVTVSEAEADP